jgi:predicted transcriptional regulator
MSQQTAKQLAVEALQTLPDDATLEDAIERLCFLAKIEEGLQQSERGEVVPHEEVKKQLLS